jgi:NodT family efflux transporter outer membrane factor (OMF) lipoprotein
MLILLIGGCNTNHMPLERAVSPPHQTRTGVKYLNNNGDLGQIAWWQALHDPMLNQLICDALAHNNEIKSAKATILQAEAQLKSAQFAWIPTLDANAQGFSGGTWNTDATPQGALSHNPFFSNLSHLRFRGYYAGFVPNYSVNILSNIYNVKSARASLAIQCATLQAKNLTIISQTAGAYFMLLSQRMQLKLEHDLIKDLNKLYELEQIRYKNGKNDIERVVTLKQQIAQEKMTVPQIEAVIAQTENTIHVLVDQNPGPIHTTRDLFAINIKNLRPQCLPATVLKNRPDIMIGSHQVAMANAAVGISYAAFFPTLNLTGLIGRASVDLVHLLKLSTAFWIAEASAATKLINASAYQNIKASRAQYYATYFNYLQTLRAAFADVDNSLSYEQKTEQAYSQAEAALAAAKKTYSIARYQYQSGAKDYRDVVNAKINVDRFALTLVQEKAQLLDSIVQVYTAVAGGARVNSED